MDERLRLAGRLLDGEKMAAVCRDFGIARKTGYKIFFTPRVCRPYRARTKGKVERFNRYLREGFYVPLCSRLQAAGLLLDACTANIEVTRWLREVANARVHGTTQQVPARIPDCRTDGSIAAASHVANA